jgi:hypothetical protein
MLGIDDNIVTPKDIQIIGNYPNPFNASTTICYFIPYDSYVKLEIYDILGRKVETIAEGEKSAGEYQIIWNAMGFDSGMYFARLSNNDNVDIRKLVLLK